MLTRKSLVRLVCRGERPIERASGWFPPKFLLGKLPQFTRKGGRCDMLYINDEARVG